MNILIKSKPNLVLQGLHSVLQKEKYISVSDVIDDGLKLLSICEKDVPEVVVLLLDEHDLAERSVLLCNIKKLSKTSGVLVLIPEINQNTFYDFHAAGALSCLNILDSHPEELITALRAVAERRLYLKSSNIKKTCKVYSNTPAVEKIGLGDREVQVLTLLANGYSSKKISQLLKISTSTVEVHRRNIMSKTSLHNIADLTRFAIRNKLITA